MELFNEKSHDRFIKNRLKLISAMNPLAFGEILIIFKNYRIQKYSGDDKILLENIFETIKNQIEDIGSNNVFLNDETFPISKEDFDECIEVSLKLKDETPKIISIKNYLGGLDTDLKLCDYFASYGNMKCLSIVHKMGCICDEKTCNMAAENGHTECLMFLYEMGLTCSSDISHEVAKRGHLNCLKFLIDNGILCNWLTGYNAVENGQYECLKFVLENVLKNNNHWYCVVAAEGGYLKCLKYLCEKGCEVEKQACEGAAKNGHIKCLEYLHKIGCSYNKLELLLHCDGICRQYVEKEM